MLLIHVSCFKPVALGPVLCFCSLLPERLPCPILALNHFKASTNQSIEKICWINYWPLGVSNMDFLAPALFPPNGFCPLSPFLPAPNCFTGTKVARCRVPMQVRNKNCDVTLMTNHTFFDDVIIPFLYIYIYGFNIYIYIYVAIICIYIAIIYIYIAIIYMYICICI